MPMNPSGVATPPSNTYGAPGAVIESAKYNAMVADAYDVITDHLAADGRKPLTGNLPAGGNKITGLGSGSAASDSITLAQAQADIIAHASSVGGTVDAITATFAPQFAAYTANMRFRWTSGGVNTVVAPTINVSGLGVKTIKRDAGSALLAGDTGASGYICEAIYNGTDVILQNPATGTAKTSTTEVLTGTDAAKSVTADALAALWEKGANVASAGTISLGEGGYFHITGTTTITDIDFGTAKDGRAAWLIFDGALTLTHNATTLALPGGANITTAAGDMAFVVQDATDNVKVAFFPATGRAVAAPTTNIKVFKTADETITADALLSMDAAIRFLAAANTKYAFEAVVWYNTATAADFKFGWDGPATPTLFYAHVDALPPDDVSTTLSASNTKHAVFKAYETTGVTLTGSAQTAAGYVRIKGILQNGANAANCGFTWSQGTSDAGNTTVLAGSHITYSIVS